MFIMIIFSSVLFKKLREELMKAFMEKASSNIDDEQGDFRVQTLEGLNVEPISFKDLVNDMISNRQDIKSFAIKTKTMVSFYTLNFI